MHLYNYRYTGERPDGAYRAISVCIVKALFGIIKILNICKFITYVFTKYTIKTIYFIIIIQSISERGHKMLFPVLHR